MIIRDVLGRELPVTKMYADGSYNCPFCGSAVTGQWARYVACGNPACPANPAFPVEIARTRLAESEARLEEERRRQASLAWSKEYSRSRDDEHRAWEAEQIARARAGGYCERCLFQSGWERAKFIRHRGPCPKTR